MDYMSSNNAVEQYEQQLGVQTTVTGTSSYTLVHMLLKGCLERISKARAYMLRGDTHKGVLISQAISILDGLRKSLDLEAGGEIAHNLDNLYEYCQRRLLNANLSNDPALLGEVSSLLREISSAWDAISPEDGQVRPISKERLCEQIHA
jgi:flagellar protein FliS